MPAQPPGANRMTPDHLPMPFSADQIRDARRPGRRSTFRVRDKEGEHLTVGWFEVSDGEEATFGRQELDADGRPQGEAILSAAWSGIRRHGSYPEGTTTVRRSVVFTLAGDFDSWLYETDRGDGSVIQSWFADALPGPPVLLSVLRGGEEVERTELIDVADPRR